MKKHTPGPWKAPKPTIGDNNCLYIGDATGNYDICEIKTAFAPSEEQARANASLIASAPELLAALEMVLDANGDLYVIDFDMLRAAVAKATRY